MLYTKEDTYYLQYKINKNRGGWIFRSKFPSKSDFQILFFPHIKKKLRIKLNERLCSSRYFVNFAVTGNGTPGVPMERLTNFVIVIPGIWPKPGNFTTGKMLSYHIRDFKYCKNLVSVNWSQIHTTHNCSTKKYYRSILPKSIITN